MSARPVNLEQFEAELQGLEGLTPGWAIGLPPASWLVIVKGLQVTAQRPDVEPEELRDLKRLVAQIQGTIPRECGELHHAINSGWGE